MKTAYLIRKQIFKQNEYRKCFSFTLTFKSPIIKEVRNQEGSNYVLCFKAVCYLNPLTQEVSVVYQVEGVKFPIDTYDTSKGNFITDTQNFFKINKILIPETINI